MLIREIDKFLSAHRLPATKFGRLAAGDPRLVFDLRNGRTPRPSTERRVEHFMNRVREQSHAY